MPTTYPSPRGGQHTPFWKSTGIIAGLLLVAAFIVVSRLPWTVNRIYNSDEANCAVIADRILHGGVAYRDAIGHRGPAAYYLFALIFALGQRFNFRAVHKALTVLHVAAALVIFRITSEIAGKRAGLFAAASFAVASLLFNGADAAAFHVGHLAFLCSAFGALLFLLGWDKGRSGFLFASGVFYGLAFLSKQPNGLDFGAALVFLGVTAGVRRNVGAVIRSAVLMCAGFVLPLILTAAYFVSRNSFHDFWFYFWTFNTRYYIPAQSLGERLLAAVVYPFHSTIDSASYFRRNWIASLCFVVFAFRVAAGRRNLQSSETQTRYLLEIFVLLWMIFAYAGAAVSGRQYSQYYLQCLAPLSIATGIVLHHVLELVQEVWIKVPRAKAEIRLLTALILVYLSVSGHALYQRIWQVSQTSWCPFATEVTHYVWENSGPEDSLFIWGFYPEFYAATQRKPATRYTITGPLTGILLPVQLDREGTHRTATVPGAWELFMKEMREAMPSVIIDTAPGNFRAQGSAPLDQYPELKDFIDKYYRLDGKILSDSGKEMFHMYKKISVGDPGPAS